jgi:hypothetical protein
MSRLVVAAMLVVVVTVTVAAIRIMLMPAPVMLAVGGDDAAGRGPHEPHENGKRDQSIQCGHEVTRWFVKPQSIQSA